MWDPSRFVLNYLLFVVVKIFIRKVLVLKLLNRHSYIDGLVIDNLKLVQACLALTRRLLVLSLAIGKIPH